MANNCLVCNKKLKAGQRGDTKFCSTKCRSKAYYDRKKAMRILTAGTLDMFQQQDAKAVATVSQLAADFIVKVTAVAGKEMGSECLDAMWDLAARCGCDFAQLLGRQS